MPVSPFRELVFFARVAGADETCLSSFMPKITVREDYVYTRGVAGLGDGNDKRVTIGANRKRPGYEEVAHHAPIPGRHEVHQRIG
jgi:selenium-binding protein 1